MNGWLKIKLSKVLLDIIDRFFKNETKEIKFLITGHK